MSDFEVCPVGTVARLAQVEAERDVLRAALEEVVRVFDSAPSSICDTVWVTGDFPETLYDRCRAAIAKVGGGNG